MDIFVSIFCHVPNDMLEEDTLQELWRQHDRLAQEAARMGRAVEHCFFHIGELDLEKPDKVFLRLMQCAQAKELGLLLIENIATPGQNPANGSVLRARTSAGDIGLFGNTSGDGQGHSTAWLCIFWPLIYGIR